MHWIFHPVPAYDSLYGDGMSLPSVYDEENVSWGDV